MPAVKKNPRNSLSLESRSYLKEISRIPLLTAEEEKDLGFRTQEGDLLAWQKLVKSNLRFVITIAKKYRGCGLSLPDLIGEGNLGLMEAARRFDPTRGVRFTSYAVWWIRQGILQALSRLGHPLRLPPKFSNTIFRLKKRATAGAAEIGTEPSVEEIAAELGFTTARLTYFLKASGNPVSLNQQIVEQGQVVLEDVLEQSSVPSPEESAAGRFLQEDLRQAVAHLNEIQGKVIRLRFGLDGGSPQTLQQIGKTMGVSRERVRQIETAALERLRHTRQAPALECYLRCA